MGSRVWPFGVTWRHWSRDHLTPGCWLSMGCPKAGVTSLLDRSYDEADYLRSWAPFCFCSLYPLNVYHRIFNFSKEYLFLTQYFKEKNFDAGHSKGENFLRNFWAPMHCFRDISKNVFLVQQIFTCKQYGAIGPIPSSLIRRMTCL